MPNSIRAELDILKYVSSANIACGGHAGNDESMRRTVRAAKTHQVEIGAHPAYPDVANFGRKSMSLDTALFRKTLHFSLMEQIIRLVEIASDEGAKVSYVKPHGALYNDAVKSLDHAKLITDVISDIDPSLIFMGAPNSKMETAAHVSGLTFVSEGFIDRRYTDDGHLQSRTIDGAVIKNQDQRMAQARALVTDGVITTASGQTLKIDAQSLCLHGDSDQAVETARLARNTIRSCGVKIQAFAYG